MTRQQITTRIGIGVIGLAIGLGALVIGLRAADEPPASDPALDQERRAVMQGVFASLASLLPTVVDPERFHAPEAREEILAGLRALTDAAEALETHGTRRDRAFEFLSRSLADDVRASQRAFEREREGVARFRLLQLTDTCVACHSRLAGDHDFVLARELVDRVDVERLGPKRLATLQFATRQFDAALDTIDGQIADPNLPPMELDLSGMLRDYLILTVRVKREPARARAALERVSARGDVPADLRRTIGIWIRSLGEPDPLPADAPKLEQAFALLDRAESLRRVPAERVGLVYELRASALLHDFIEHGEGTAAEQARAYLGLGLAEMRARRSFWISDASFYLESAVRLSPRSETAREAFATLEEQVLAGYSGSSGVHVPLSEEQRLAELRSLIDGS